MKKYLFFTLICLLSTKTLGGLVQFTSPSDGQIFYTPSGQNYMDVQVSWSWNPDTGENDFTFVLTTDVGTFDIDKDQRSYIVHNVPHGTKQWHIRAQSKDRSWGDDDVTFNVYLTTVTITADNNFIVSGGNSHGSIKVDGNTGTAPWYFQKDVGQNLTLEAVSPQTDNEGYQRLWNSCVSYWDHDGEFKSANQTYSLHISESDLNTTYKANLGQVRTTTNGTLTTNETWFTSIALDNDVQVPTGITLTITSCASVNLNGHSILSSGGTISNQGSVSGLAAIITSYGAIKGLCPTIQTAVNNASGLNTVEVQSGTFSGDITIASKNGLRLVGQGKSSTTIQGSLTFSNSTGAGLAHLTSYYVEFTNCSDCVTTDHEITDGSGLYLYACPQADVSPTANNCEDGVDIVYNSTGIVFSV